VGQKVGATAKTWLEGGPASRLAGWRQSASRRPPQRGQVREWRRVARRLQGEGPTLRAQPDGAQLPALHVSTTSAAFHGNGRTVLRPANPLRCPCALVDEPSAGRDESPV